MGNKIIIVSFFFFNLLTVSGCTFYKSGSLIKNGKVSKKLVKSKDETVLIIRSLDDKVWSVINGKVDFVIDLGDEKILQIQQGELSINISNFDSLLVRNNSFIKRGDMIGIANKEGNHFEIAIRILRRKDFLNAKEIFEFVEPTAK